MKIKPNLYLNMSPQTTEEGALAFARNMKLDDDGNLVSDYGYKNIVSMANYTIVGHIVGLDNKIYFFCYDNNVSKIVEYDEITEEAVELNTNWTYNGGEIDGYVNTNQSGEKILTIGEYIKGGSNIPLKHINLDYRTIGNESFYSQAPICPTVNLTLRETYVKAIPNGVYVFFIRYKIRKDVYTNWFLCSRPMFAGTSENIVTLQGGLKFINNHKDSAKSFVFQLNFVNELEQDRDKYKEFQLGFIITHDEATDARIWKHFNISDFVVTKPHYHENGYDDENLIYFDYENVEEANIDDLLETTYELYNVRNITSFKNKLYISNYIETNFNPDLSNLVSYIDVNYIEERSTDSAVQNEIVVSDIELGDYRFDNDDIGYYPITNNINVDIIKSILDFNISDFYKVESSEVDKALSLTLFGRVDENPDIIYVNGFTNRLHNYNGLPSDFSVNFNSKGNGWNDIGLTAAQIGLSGVYNIYKFGDGHPLYGKMNFAYGLFGENVIPSGYSDYAEGNIVLINKDSLDNNKAVAGASFIKEDVTSNIRLLVEKEVKKLDRFIMGYATITSGGKKYIINSPIEKNTFEKNNYIGTTYDTDYKIENINNSSDSDITNAIINKICTFIVGYAKGIDDNGNIVITYNGDYIKFSSIEFTFKACEFIINNESEINTNNEGTYNHVFDVTLKTTIYNCFCTFNIKDNKITITPSDLSDEKYKQQSTLMPLSTYKAYVHFVDNHNIITNGYYLKDINIGGALYSDLSKFKLTYSVDNAVNSYVGNYKSFFISLKNTGNIIVETFARSYKNGYNIVNVLEADALLYNINDDITLIRDDGSLITNKAKYYPSGMAIPSLSFGNCGYVAWKDEPYAGRVYIKITRNINEEETSLIKATPYIPLSATSETQTVNDGFYGSYFCSVKKPSLALSSSCYVSGNDIYSATRDNIIKLKEFDGYISLQDSTLHFIRSNFNLNYLSLTEDISDKIHKISNTIKDIKQPIKIINSAILSSIYELKSMYRDFSNKTFNKISTDYKINFDNTIRVSNVLSDETFNNSVFKFASGDYYNVPTDRGKIINLFSIGNNIFVHCEGSLYKFDGNATIAANDKDIQLQSSEPFDAGISQIIDSEYGYGGIVTKQAGCITFDSYFFYDQASNHIFAYGGNSQIQLIDGNIYKLLAHYRPSDCKTLHDECNCRVLFEFTSGRPEYNLEEIEYKTFTLSYNYKTKTFVSFQDISLVKTFASRHKSYSYKSALINLFNTENAINTSPLVEGMNVNQIFGSSTTACIIEFGSQIYKKQASPFGIAVVLLPQANLKETVDSVKYVADIQQLDPETQTTPVYDVLVNPQVTRNNPVTNFYIITDSCVSSLVTTNVDDTARPNSLLDYEGFKYDMGFWTSNYFRNNINKIDIYNYGKKYPNRALDADNNSLVYGRYFILVFDFKPDTPIKFEDIYINTDKY